MKIVLLSGGSGKRLWPLSNHSRAKQFLRVLENEKGERESMVQRIWGQLKYHGLDELSVISTNKAQVDIIQNQLGNEINLIVEPESRDTFPAIALAAAYLYSVEGLSLKDTVVVLPVDSYVDVSFFQKVKQLEEALFTSQADLALIGVKPTYSAEKYGYLIPEEAEIPCEPYLNVIQFKEKPREDQAKKLIEQGALWNCGIFGFRLDTVISLLIKRGLPIQYESLLGKYGELPKTSFDYEVVENVNHTVVLPYTGAWRDLGTWNTLTEEMNSHMIGPGILGEKSFNTHVINELEIPVMVLGLSDAVIATSPDGILVSSKAASPRIKDLVSTLDCRPMYEERRWGWYKVVDYTRLAEGGEVLTKRIGITAGKNLSYQLHYKRSEVWTIISGEGEFVLNDHLYYVQPGDVLKIPIGAKHGIKAITDLEFIEVQTGSELVEEDIVRLCMTWRDVEAILEKVNK